MNSRIVNSIQPQTYKDTEEINKSQTSNAYYSENTPNHNLHRPTTTHDPTTNSKRILSGSTSPDVLPQGQVLLSKFIISCEPKRILYNSIRAIVNVNHICIVHKMNAGNIMRMRSERSKGLHKGLFELG